MRKPHYWKPTGRSAYPSEIVVVDTETWRTIVRDHRGWERHTLDLGVAKAFRLEKGKRTREDTLRFRKADVFWDWLHSRMNRQRPVWLWGHNLAFDLGVLGGWRHLAQPQYAWKRCVMDGSLFFAQMVRDGKTLWLADSFNYYRCSLAAIGTSLGLPKMAMPLSSASDGEWYDYCERDVEVVCRAICNLIEFCRSHNLGPWQPTVSSLAFSAYRHRFMRHKVLVHTYRDALRLERAAYYGGAVDTPYIGRTYHGPITELDVNSMYPAVCMSNLPYRIRGYRRNPTARQVEILLDKFACIANVTVESEDYAYPYRQPERTVYPHGRYDTQLAGPELLHALRSDHIKGIHEVAYYEQASIFREYVEYFHNLKNQYSLDNDRPFRDLTKLFMNGLYGKTGQQTARWVVWGEASMRLLEERYGFTVGSLQGHEDVPPRLEKSSGTVLLSTEGIRLSVRNYWGYWEVNVGSHESRDSVPAIAASVTSAARCLLREYQSIAGERNWYYSDTDSVWVNNLGLDRLRLHGSIQPSSLGKLKEERTVPWMIIHGPKDYEIPETKKQKGIRKDAIELSEEMFSQLHFPSPGTQIRDQESNAVIVRRVIKEIRRSVDNCHVTAEKWTRPLRMPDDDIS